MSSSEELVQPETCDVQVSFRDVQDVLLQGGRLTLSSIVPAVGDDGPKLLSLYTSALMLHLFNDAYVYCYAAVFLHTLSL